jgi:O-antigen/teichoic acid export membrane protein
VSKFVRDSFLAFLGEVVMFAGALVYGLITARVLGPSGKGVIGVLLVAYGFIVTIISLRFERAIAFYAASKGEAVSETLTGALAMGAAMLVGFFPLYWLLPDGAKFYLFGGVDAEYVAAGILFLPATYLSGVIAAIQAGRRKFESRLMFLLLTNGARIAAAFVGLVLLNISLRSFILLIGTVEIVTDIILLVMLYRRNAWTLRFNIGHTWSMIRFSASGVFGVIAEMAMSNAPLFILGVVSGSYDAGLFVVSIMITNTLAYLANAVKVVVLPHVAATSGSLDEAKVLRVLLLIELAMALGLIATGRFLLSLLYGPQFDGSFVPALILIPGVVGFTYYGILTASVQGRGKPGLASVPPVIGGICAIGLSLAMIQGMGIFGAAIGATVSNLAGAVAAILIYARLTKVPVVSILLVRKNEVRDLIFSVRARLSNI